MKSVKETAIELKQRLEELKKEQYEIERQLNDLRNQVQPEPRYGNMKVIIDPEYQDFMSKEVFEAVRFVDYLLNEDEKNEHMKIFGSISGDWKESRGSVTYIRNEYGVLIHKSGGWVFLKEGIPCTDDEWEAIKQGNIPDKFKTKNIM